MIKFPLVRVRISFCLLLFISLVGYSGYAECPPCYKNEQPKTFSGTDNYGRPTILVAIARSWDDTPGHTNANIWISTQNAIYNWNVKTTASGSIFPYYFKYDGNAINVGVKIIKNPSLTTCGDKYGYFGGPYWIQLPEGAQLRPEYDLTATIERTGARSRPC